MFAARRQPAVRRSDVSINQMASTACPHPAAAALRVSASVYLHSLRSRPLMRINMKTYLFSVMWASTLTRLTVPTFENRGFQNGSPEWIG